MWLWIATATLSPRNDGALGGGRSLDSGSGAGCPRGMTENSRGMTGKRK
ncbi:MAG: hypothetical protein NC218_11115 [Acetobacter sp.]|nr:hypothetical protein [Acetobacter sp.]